MGKTILYIANTPAPSDIDKYRKLGFIAVNASNYNFQVMSGFVHNENDVHSIFIDKHLNTSRHFQENSVNFHYLTNYLSIPSFIKSLKLNSLNTLVICDTLHLRGVLLSMPYLKLKKFKMIGIVTDLYCFFHKKGSFNLKSYLFVKLGELTMDKYDAFVVISEKMRNESFVKNKPILVAEGIYDLPEIVEPTSKEEVILYSGALEREYGILNLMDAINELKQFPFKLHIYSASPIYPEFNNKLNDRVVYNGYLDRTNLLIKQHQAKALINPRPLDLPFNAYSFPSKLIEYMASGTPTITSALPSIPERFLPGLYIIEDTSINGLKTALNAFTIQSYLVHQNKADYAKQLIETEYAHYKIAKKIEQLIQ